MKPSEIDILSNRRNLFPHIANGYRYLNHCAISPLSLPVYQAVNEFLTVRSQGPVEDFDMWMAQVSECRERIRQLINASDKTGIAFTSNTSDGLSLVAEGLDWNEGDQIILNDMEFPANVHPFRALERHGVELVYLKSVDNRIDPEQIENAITSHTRMVSISAVQYLSGFRANLESIGDICRSHGLLFVVDGIQALGATPVDVRKAHIDALATGGHKWLMSPMGCGFLFLSDTILERMKFFKTGWLSVENPWDLKNYDQPWKTNAGRFETGTPNMSGIIGMNASLNNLLSIGLNAIRDHISELATCIIEQVRQLGNCSVYTPVDPGHRAGIVTFSLPEGSDADTLIRALKDEKIIVSCRDGMIRVAPHYYNTTDELDILFSHIKEKL